MSELCIKIITEACGLDLSQKEGPVLDWGITSSIRSHRGMEEASELTVEDVSWLKENLPEGFKMLCFILRHYQRHPRSVAMVVEYPRPVARMSAFRVMEVLSYPQ